MASPVVRRRPRPVEDYAAWKAIGQRAVEAAAAHYGVTTADVTASRFARAACARQAVAWICMELGGYNGSEIARLLHREIISPPKLRAIVKRDPAYAALLEVLVKRCREALLTK